MQEGLKNLCEHIYISLVSQMELLRPMKPNMERKLHAHIANKSYLENRIVPVKLICIDES